MKTEKKADADWANIFRSDKFQWNDSFDTVWGDTWIITEFELLNVKQAKQTNE